MPLDIATLTKRWMVKADKDLMVALLLVPQGPLLSEEIGFHCQQAAEKYLKAYMVLLNRMPPRTHNLEDLINLIRENKPESFELLEDAIRLSEYAVNLRYPLEEENLENEEVRSLIKAALRFRTAVQAWTSFSEPNLQLYQLLRQNGF